MRSATNVAWASGPLVVASYVAAAVVVGWLRGDDARRAAVAEAAVALGAVTVGWHVTRAVAPGVEVSAVGFASVQVLLVWQSVALWCGAAAVLGAVAPVLSGFRGSSGLAAAGAITAVHAPAVLLAAVGGFAVGLAVFRGRVRDALAVALAAPPAYEWVAWSADLDAGWGVGNGPELALWTAAVSVLLLARWWADAPAAPGGQ